QPPKVPPASTYVPHQGGTCPYPAVAMVVPLPSHCNADPGTGKDNASGLKLFKLHISSDFVISRDASKASLSETSRFLAPSRDEAILGRVVCYTFSLAPDWNMFQEMFQLSRGRGKVWPFKEFPNTSGFAGKAATGGAPDNIAPPVAYS